MDAVFGFLYGETCEVETSYVCKIELTYKAKLFLLYHLGKVGFLKEFHKVYDKASEKECKGAYLYALKLMYSEDRNYRYATSKYSLMNLAYLLSDKGKALNGKSVVITAFDGSAKEVKYSIEKEVEYSIERAYSKLILNINALVSGVVICGNYVLVKTKRVDLVENVISNFKGLEFNIIEKWQE